MKKDYILPNLDNARKRDKNISDTLIFNVEDKYKDLGKNKKYFVITHGCQANERDSENIAGLLECIGYTKTNDKALADIVIINTCAIREGAEDKVYGEIGALKRYKNTNPNLIIGICGWINSIWS